MKALARKVEDFLTVALGGDDAPCEIFTSTGDGEIVRPCIRIDTVTGWQPGFLFKYGERTATVTVTVETNTDDDDADAHDELAAHVEACLGDDKTVTESALSIADFSLKLWEPGDSASSTEDRVKQTVFNYSARVRDDNSNRS